MSEYRLLNKGKLVLKGEKPEKSKKRKHKKEKKDKPEEVVLVDEDAVAHGGWWKCKKLQEVSGSICIEFAEGQYVKSVDDGTFVLGVKHEKGEPPAFDEELTAFVINDSKIYIKSGYGKYLTVESNNVITGRSDAAGALECFEPVWDLDNGQMAIQAANNSFLSIDDEDDTLVAVRKKAGEGEVCVIRSNAYRGEIISKNAPIEEKVEDIEQIEENYVRKFQKFQDKKLRICTEDKSQLKKAKEQGKLHEGLLDRRSKMKADRYCK